MHKEIRKVKKDVDKGLNNLMKKDEKIDKKIEKCDAMPMKKKK